MTGVSEKEKAWEAAANRAAAASGTPTETKAQVLDYFRALDTTLGNGLKYFREKDTKGQWKDLLDTLESTHAGTTPPSGFELNDSHYIGLLELALAAASIEGNPTEADKAISMFLDLGILFPLNVQPMILLASLLWREKGIEKALELYEQLLPLHVHPMIHYYAADCLWAAGQKDRARTTLDNALKLCDADPHFNEIKAEITAYKQSLKE